MPSRCNRSSTSGGSAPVSNKLSGCGSGAIDLGVDPFTIKRVHSHIEIGRNAKGQIKTWCAFAILSGGNHASPHTRGLRAIRLADMALSPQLLQIHAKSIHIDLRW